MKKGTKREKNTIIYKFSLISIIISMNDKSKNKEIENRITIKRIFNCLVSTLHKKFIDGKVCVRILMTTMKVKRSAHFEPRFRA